MTHTKRRFLPAIIAVGVAGLLACIAYANLSPGATAPAFTLPTVDGKTFTSTTGKVVLMDIWATWCPPCRAEIPYLVNLHKKLADKGVLVLGVAIDSNKNGVAQFVKKMGIRYTVALDPEATKLSKDYKLEGVPATYVIDKTGVVRYVHFGFSSDKTQQEKEATALQREATTLLNK